MKKLFLIAATAALVLASCSKNEIIENTVKQPTIDFGTYVAQSPITKTGEGSIADAVALANAGGFEVHILNGSNSYYPNDIAVTSDNGTDWITGATVYWPADPETTLTFKAWGPANANLAYNSTSLTINNIGTSTFDVVWDQQEKKYSDVSSSKGVVKFDFKHILAKVDFKVKIASFGANGKAVSVTEVKFGSTSGNFASTATLDLAKGTAEAGAEDLAEITALAPSNGTSTAVSLTANTEAALANDNPYYLVAPETSEITIPVTVKYTVTDNSGISESYTKTGNLTLKPIANTYYTVVITLPDVVSNAITFGVTSVVGWTTGSGSVTVNSDVTAGA